MIKFTHYRTVLISLLVAISSCVDDNQPFIGHTSIDGNTVSIFGRISAFDNHFVESRAGKTPDESYTSSMAMAIFPIEDGSVGECISYIHLQGSNVNFTVDRAKLRETYGDIYDDKPFAIYLFANMPELPANMAGLTDRGLSFFLDKAYANSGIRRPQKGFPMVGSLGDNVTEGADGKEFILIPTEGEDENLKIKLPTLDGTPSDYIPIPLQALYAKFSFDIKLEPDQYIQNGAAPSFTLESYTLKNVPNSVYADSTDNIEHTRVLADSIITTVGNTIYEGGSIEFDFYLPERFLTPTIMASNYDYPLGENGASIKASEVRTEDSCYLQRFKPELVASDKKATYVTLKGFFSDHQNHNWEVDYDIYLGEDNYSDFNFSRNKNYINNVVIRGLKASKDQSFNTNGVFIDHRVNVTRSLPIIINLQRETMLDSHYEVRPLRVRYPGTSLPAGAKVKVEILNSEDSTAINIPDWVRIEHNNGTGAITDTHLASGKRKYFTTDLVNTTLAANTSVEGNIYAANINETFWIYVDQCDFGAPLSNPNKVREALIKVTYTDTDPATDAEEPIYYRICQHLLYPVQTIRLATDVNETSVSTGEYIYYIEYEEEYLHNFDSEDCYGSTEDGGMEWGLNDIQLSHIDEAINVKAENSGLDWIASIFGWNKQQIVDNAITQLDPKPYYDFYMVRDVIATTPIAPYAFDGLNFSNKIVSYLKEKNPTHQTDGESDAKTAKVENISLEEQPKSAIAYCYNRNKRNSDGKVVSVDWYLPAIDEIEDIMENAYGDFDTEFQGNMYWSSQPAYYKHESVWTLSSFLGGSQNVEGVYYIDNPNRARATRALRENGVFLGVPDSGDGTYATQKGEIYAPLFGNPSIDMEDPVLNSSYDKECKNYGGNLARTGTKARVRCIRKSEGVTVVEDD